MQGHSLGLLPLVGFTAWVAALVGLAALALVVVAGCLLTRRRAAVAHNPIVAPETQNVTLTASGSRIERRRSHRRAGIPIVVQVTGGGIGKAPVEALILNRSLGGLCLSLKQELAVGALLSVRASLAPKSVPWTPVTVIYCLPFVDRWKVGCRFEETPNDEVLLLFG